MKHTDMDKIEVPFGAKDSELKGWEYTIPEGMEAFISDGKVVVRKKESGDERTRKWILEYLYDGLRKADEQFKGQFKSAIDWLEKQKEHSMSAEEVLIKAGLKPYKDGNQWCILVGDNIQEGICGFGDTIDEALYQFLMVLMEDLI